MERFFYVWNISAGESLEEGRMFTAENQEGAAVRLGSWAKLAHGTIIGVCEVGDEENSKRIVLGVEMIPSYYAQIPMYRKES